VLRTFPFECESAFAYFFDCGIIIRGLLGAWRATNETEFLDVAVESGRAMLADFRDASTIHPILALPDKHALPYQPRWSASPGCYQLKAAMAWYELFERTGEKDFLNGYEDAVGAALLNERSFLPGDANCEKVMDRLHAYTYFLEGLFPVLNRADCATAFAAGLKRAAGYLREIAPQFVRSDVYAQILRARLYGESAGVVPLDCDAAAEEALGAAAFRLESEDPRIEGGFGFGRKNGELLPFVNPVSTAFAVQALALWSDRNENVLKASRQILI
jgi:hypothetical protein